MTLQPLGDSAWLVEFPGTRDEVALAQVTGCLAALRHGRPSGVVDIVPSFDTLAVHFEGVDGAKIREWLEQVEISPQPPTGDEVVIPVCYDGPDLDVLADFAGLTRDEVVSLHSGALYTVAAVGFSPGFPYLTGLPERLKIPRRATPRLRVPAGSVAVGGGQAGIYPCASPGGWHLLGRSPVALFDPHADPPALLKSGDRVRFLPVESVEMPAEFPPPDFPSHGPVEVIHPGALSVVQDLGRPGYEAQGVSPGGAVDRHALRLANLLVGNAEGAAALEICLRGPVLKFHAATVVAVAGATGKSQPVAAGETLDFSAIAGGVRACIAFAGGLQIPHLLGSAATDLHAGFGGFGGRALRAGDRLQTCESGRIPRSGDWFAGTADAGSCTELRFLPGVQAGWFSTDAAARFRGEAFLVTPHSDRMGARLAGPPLTLRVAREMVSQPVACGSVQVPPDGQPIVLLAGRQTIGGYPQIGHVISADLPKLARLRPGSEVRFREISRGEAVALRDRVERDFAKLRCGLELLKCRPCDASI